MTDTVAAREARHLKKGLILGLDLGGTKILAGVVTPYNKIVGRAKRKTPFASTQDILATELIGCAEDALRAARITAKDISAIGMGSPGPLDPDKGVVLRTPNIALRNFPVRQILSKHFGVPAVVDNDVNMAGFGEFKAGAGRGCRNMVGIWVGTGIGGVIIRDGQVVHGANRNAGEVGHIILDVRRHLADRKRGTLETEAGKTGITAYIRRKVEAGEKSVLAKALRENGERLKSSALVEALKDGDELAVRAVERSARYCGIAIANLFNLLSPELFILGGGVVEAVGPSYIKRVQQSADKFAYTTELAPIKIAPSELGDDAGVLGAAIAAREKTTD